MTIVDVMLLVLGVSCLLSFSVMASMVIAEGARLFAKLIFGED